MAKRRTCPAYGMGSGCFLLAVLHQDAAAEPLVRLWDTRSWEVATHVSLGLPAPGRDIGGVHSLSWLGRDVLLATGAGRLVEISVGVGGSALGGLGPRLGAGQGGGLQAWLAGLEPTVRELPLPAPEECLQELSWGSQFPGQVPSRSAIVLEVAVCPRSAQRVALRVQGCQQVLVFERPRCGLAGWSRRELLPCGKICASGADGEDVRPLALSFARGVETSEQRSLRSGELEGCFEGSLLAIYWSFSSQGANRGEVRTYPMHYLPTQVLQGNAATNSQF